MNLKPLPDLPVNEAIPALKQALSKGRSAILQAPPGAGKSTLVPLLLLDESWLAGQKIIMLEPRRIAARAVASRMSALLHEPVGQTVGFRTRLETRVGRMTRIEVVTEGILTRMLQTDAALPGCRCVIFDEFHERSLNADLGLALLIETQQALRDDLRILVMSATLEPLALAKLLHDAPLVAAQGRSFAVETRYVPRRADLAAELQAANVVRAALHDDPGDILCFLPGAPEIRRLQRALETAPLYEDALVLPLYGDLDAAAQDAALRPIGNGRRKIVLATSIAESSLTIEGIRVVVDLGLRRFSAFDPATGMSRLMTGNVSQASADQRRGRAGRLSDGVCYRLWSQGTHATLSPQTPPEILHADLAPLALELACWGTPAGSLAWLDLPPAAPLAQAKDLLRQLGALDAAERVTAHGRELATFGMHPRLGHMLSRSRELPAVQLACDLAAILSERDVLRPGRLRDSDIRLRVQAMRSGVRSLPPEAVLDEHALLLARRSSANWWRSFGGSGAETDSDRATGVLLAFAYPDRIGQARDDSGRYLLANGRGARFAEPQALCKSQYVVAAALDGAERDARIFLAAPIERDDLYREFAVLVQEQSEIRWDDKAGVVHARRERRLGALLLDSADLPAPDAEAVERAAVLGLKHVGIAALPWTRDLRQWQSRVLLMRRHAVPAPLAWPDMSDAVLQATIDTWAPAWMTGMTRLAHFQHFDLRHALQNFLDHAQRSILEREAPTHFVVPSGSSIPIDYVDGEVPTLSVRLQELFGMRQTPAVAVGRQPLLLKLLSPAGRPVQITRDLISFWDRGYHEVKKDLKGRYPKHYWPDDPYAAQATRRARPRG